MTYSSSFLINVETGVSSQAGEYTGAAVPGRATEDLELESLSSFASSRALLSTGNHVLSLGSTSSARLL